MCVCVCIFAAPQIADMVRYAEECINPENTDMYMTSFPPQALDRYGEDRLKTHYMD